VQSQYLHSGPHEFTHVEVVTCAQTLIHLSPGKMGASIITYFTQICQYILGNSE